ncbi:MAG: glycosyltransferase family 2 protein [Spartobacteria bacterium]|nr:glycosyltransferase family 2 protein [Spartobacteria bacterium]
MKYKGITVVIPCLNEESSIGEVIEAARAGIAKTGLAEEIIVVDNGSTDRSVEIAGQHNARIVRETHRGYGAALRKGFASASYGIMVMGDGDLTYDFSKLDEMVRPIMEGRADFVIGNRMHNIQPGAMPTLHRYIGNPILSFVLRLMFHSRAVHDAHCGMRAITREAYKQLNCVTTGMEFASEMVIRAIRCKLRIEQQDIIYHPRVGDSKLRTFQDGWRHMRFMMLHSPTTILLWPGLLGWLLGLAIAIPLAMGPVYIKGRLFDIHCMIMGGLLNIVSVQVITIGLLAKAYAHLSGLHHDPVVAWLYKHMTFEKTIILSGLVMLLGLVFTLAVIGKWIISGFGALNEARPLFFAMLCLINGIQIGAASYLFSIMALPRHLDHSPRYAEDTAVVDT